MIATQIHELLKKPSTHYFLTILIVLTSCNDIKTASEILQETINSIDTIETIYYKQDMSRTNPGNMNDTIFRYREMYFERLITDSIVGVKGHWYMYLNNKENVVYEDIYDGNRLIRKNNQVSAARIYDLVKYPDLGRIIFGAIILFMECNMNSVIICTIQIHTQLRD